MNEDEEAVVKAVNEAFVLLAAVQFSMKRIESAEALAAYQAVSLAVRSLGEKK